MNRQDMVAQEQHQARTYFREAKRRRPKNPALADQLNSWGQASLSRAETLRSGPLWARDE